VNPDRAHSDLPTWTENAVLVYGPRKGGTTLLLNLLDGSEAMLAFPAEVKTKFFHRWAKTDITRDRYVAESRVPELDRDEVSVDTYLTLWKETDPAPLAGDLRALLQRDAWYMYRAAIHPPAAPRLWCAKDVGGKTHAIIALWRHCFPHSRLVFILRHPLQVARAVLNDRRRNGRRLSFLKIAREIADPMRVVAAQASYLDAGSILPIAYEDLVDDTEGTMRRVAGFLCVAYDEVLTRPTVFGQPVVVSTSSRRTTTVFRSENRWSDGLPFRERFWVGLTWAVLRWHPRFAVDYPAIRRRISARATRETVGPA